MTPRVLHLSTYAGGGGAARAAAAVDLALQTRGVDSRLLSAHGTKFRAARAADRALWRLQRSATRTWRSPARFGSVSASDINASSADIVNLHWVTDGFLSIEQIGRISKPIVMSMYDMWPFCGSEHYGVDTPDARWRIGYTHDNRPADETGWDIDRDSWERKRRHWQGFHLIPASSWLTQAVSESALMSRWPVTRIPHPVNPAIFKPVDKVKARTQLGIDARRPTIAFLASAGITDERKGFDLLASALPQVRGDFPDVQVLVVGPAPERNQLPPGIDVIGIGQAHGDDALVRSYCAADVLAVPSREDNMPLTAMEAHMTGRPVVAFNIGGLPDIVAHRETGFLAPPLDAHNLGLGLSEALANARSSNSWGEQARERALRTWSFNAVADEYLNVYRQVLQ